MYTTTFTPNNIMLLTHPAGHSIQVDQNTKQAQVFTHNKLQVTFSTKGLSLDVFSRIVSSFFSN